MVWFLEAKYIGMKLTHSFASCKYLLWCVFVPRAYPIFMDIISLFMNHLKTISVFLASRLRAVYILIYVFGSHICNLEFFKNPQTVVNNSLN